MRTPTLFTGRPRRAIARRLGTYALTIAVGVVPLTARAQFVFTDREAWRDFAQNRAGGIYLCASSLDRLPNGATTIPLFLAPFEVIRCDTATLSGATVTNGRIESTTPFTLLLAADSFGVDFGTPGSDVAYISFYAGTSLVGTISRPISGTSNQFLGVVLFSAPSRKPDRFVIGVQGGSTFFVDNITTTVPEPSVAMLLGGGLLALGGGAAVRRRTRRG